MVDGLGGITAVETPPSRQQVEGATPSPIMGFGAEVFQENTIPGQHAIPPTAAKFACGVSSGNVSLTALSLFAQPPARAAPDAPGSVRAD